MSLAVKTEDLCKEYDEVVALDNVSLSVEEGSFFGLLGPNGAGKTTLISILVGLVKKTSGSANVFGYDIENDYKKVRDLIGVAPQEINIDRFFSIEDVLIHKAGYHGITHNEAKERAQNLMKKFGIFDKKDQPVNNLSGGMKRRLLLARSLINDPKLWILDEPTAGVDVGLRHELWDIMREMNHEGRTIILTTHYIEEAEALCEEVSIMDEGNIVKDGSPEDLTSEGLDTLILTINQDVVEEDLDISFAESFNINENKVFLKVKNATEVLPETVDYFESLDLTISNIEIKETTLEDMFMELTGDISV